MPFKSLKEKLSSQNYSISFGEIIKINATVITASGLKVSIGDMVKMISNDTAQESMGMVTEIDGRIFFITPFVLWRVFALEIRFFLILLV